MVALKVASPSGSSSTSVRSSEVHEVSSLAAPPAPNWKLWLAHRRRGRIEVDVFPLGGTVHHFQLASDH